MKYNLLSILCLNFELNLSDNFLLRQIFTNGFPIFSDDCDTNRNQNLLVLPPLSFQCSDTVSEEDLSHNVPLMSAIDDH